MSAAPAGRPVICAGSALWDIIAQAQAPLHQGADVPGRIERRLGGVALNVALALAAQGMPVTLLSALGRDSQGDRLILALTERGVDCSHVTRTEAPTDSYLAVEDVAGEVFAAVADCAGLEAAGAAILAPLADGRLAGPEAPWEGQIVVDGNLPEAVLRGLARDPLYARAEIAFVPASPGKAGRMVAALDHGRGTLYLNRGEAEVLCGRPFADSRAAALAIREKGVARAVVTDGARALVLADGAEVVEVAPPGVAARSVTGAGDAFLAAHLAATARGLAARAALEAAAAVAAAHIMREGR